MRMEARRMAEAEDVPRVGRHVDLLTNKAFSWKWLGAAVMLTCGCTMHG